jgi:hypothetical protein
MRAGTRARCNALLWLFVFTRAVVYTQPIDAGEIVDPAFDPRENEHGPQEGSVRELDKMETTGATGGQPYVAPERVTDITTGESLYTSAAVLARTASWGGLMSFLATGATVAVALVVKEAIAIGEPLVAFLLMSTACAFAITSIVLGSTVLEAAPLSTIALTALFSLIALLGTVVTILAAGVAFFTAVGLVVYMLHSLRITPVIKAVHIANTYLPSAVISVPQSLVTQLQATVHSQCGTHVRDGIMSISALLHQTLGKQMGGSRSTARSTSDTFGDSSATPYSAPSASKEPRQGAAASNPYAGDEDDDAKWEKEQLIDFGAGGNESTVTMEVALASTAAAKMEWMGEEAEGGGQGGATSDLMHIKHGYGHDEGANPWGEGLDSSYTSVDESHMGGASTAGAPSVQTHNVLTRGAMPSSIPPPQQPSPPPPPLAALAAPQSTQGGAALFVSPPAEFGDSLLQQQYEKEQLQKESPQQLQAQPNLLASLNVGENAPNPFAGDDDDDDQIFCAAGGVQFDSDED